MKATRWLFLIAGILLVIVGIYMFSTPLANIMGLAVFITVAMLVSGISEIIHWGNADKNARSGWLLASGILSTLLGVWVIFGHGSIANIAVVIPFIFGIWVLMGGILRFVGALTMKKEGIKSWGWVLFSGAVGVILGFIFMYHPLFAAATVSMLIACLFLFQGINSVLLFFTLNKTSA